MSGVAVLLAAALAPPPEPGPKLTFTQDGKDLVVTATVEVPDAPHVLWTRAVPVMHGDPYLLGPRRPPELVWVDLSFEVFQSRDDPVVMHMPHHTKRVELRWRLADHAKADVPYRVIRRFQPSAAELKELAPQFARLAEETERRQKDPKLTVP
jgi:hypothetical protein